VIQPRGVDQGEFAIHDVAKIDALNFGSESSSAWNELKHPEVSVSNYNNFPPLHGPFEIPCAAQ
jgi:hypothetical protein